MDIKEYYRLKLLPFSNSPDEQFYYRSPEHEKAFFKIMHAIDNKLGLAIVVGDIGTGKTTISRKLLNYLSSNENYEPALLIIIHSEISSEWLVKKIALQLGLEKMPDNKVDIINGISRRLMELNEEGKNVVILIDEANMLKSKEIMEELRGILNIEPENTHLLTFVLFGLKELENSLKLDMPLYERIAVKCTLNPMDFKSTMGYIKYRLKVAGKETPLFDEKAVELIYKYSKGKPRLINILCDNAMLEGFLTKKEIIDEKIVKQVLEDFGMGS
ncbi:AAA family ATPase [candidate division TA06 bacterium]|uniref:AAA family ATPase n=1 Tax=candidate division TA06 bacterium TaxID=2250710 RepID=A0A660SB55_UNCT6|nr:MAG: AAA family ATPase [candidate division TA06 bacterium]